MSSDYAMREYLSVGEVSSLTGLPVKDIHLLVRKGEMKAFKSGGGQYRFRLQDVKGFCSQDVHLSKRSENHFGLQVNQCTQNIWNANSNNMNQLKDNSVHLAVTSPPYFNAKMYSEEIQGDLGNVHNLERWLQEIKKVWTEVYNKLQPGRKFFLNIMNLPIREDKTFRSINLVGKNIDLCEEIGFRFKRDIVWHKTNGVRAHFGTYPYPGGILINNMHEFILEFEKPQNGVAKKYAHVTKEQKERSKLDKEFWLALKNSDVWLMKPEKSGGNRSHVAPYPTELPERLIKAFTFEGETILDPFLGSGTTLEAAALNRRCGVGYEINPEFCQLATERLQALQGNLKSSLGFELKRRYV